MAAASTMMMLNGKFFFNSPRKILAATQNSLTKEEEKRILVPKGISMKKVSIVGAILTTLESPKSSLALQNVVEGQGEGVYRSFALLIPIIPAVGWALLIILRPALNQLNQMRNKSGR